MNTQASNSLSTSEGYFVFSKPFILEISGKDAQRYLNARLTINISTLSNERGAIAAQLTPQGKPEGVFTIVYSSERNVYYLFSPFGDHAAMLSAFKRYIVADRVSVADRSAETVLIHLSTTLDSLRLQRGDVCSTAPFEVKWINDACFITFPRISSHGLDVILRYEDVPLFMQELTTQGYRDLSFQEFERGRFLSRIPSFPSEIDEKRVFLESGLTDAISKNKGCYTGQEVIERVDALGKLPRRVRWLEIDRFTLPSEGPLTVKLLDGTPIGEVLSTFQDRIHEKVYAFVSVKNEIELGQSVNIEGAQATLLPAHQISNVQQLVPKELRTTL
jgi:folate-binding protein YgfZ